MKKTRFVAYLLIYWLTVFAQPLKGQEADPVSDTLRNHALKVFMSAGDYIKREIPYLNYVRDIKEAQVYIMTTYQSTGSGGMETTYFLVGQHEFAGMADTIRVLESPDDTEDICRAKRVRSLKMGLMRYVQKTPLSEYIDVTFNKPLKEQVSTDPWNSWVFRSSIHGSLNGETSYISNDISASLSANRVTEAWKYRIYGSASLSQNKYIIEDTTIFANRQSYNVSGSCVKSLTDHWSAGVFGTIASSTYSNSKLGISLMPGIEYDIFPYKESTRRQLTFQYMLGFWHYNYADTTIYDKIRENLLGHRFNIGYEVVQKWGSVDASLNWSNFFHDWSKNSLSGWLSVDLRIAKGLNLNIGGGASLNHEQLSLVKGGSSYEEILLRIKEIRSSYFYYTSFGLSYTFGSIYNNAVNPRFGNN